MTEVFLKLINMSITASWIVLAVILLRFLLKKAPRGIICALWALVAIRLVCPFSVESMLSLIPSAETVPEEIVYAREPVIDSGVPIINQTVNPIITSTFAPPDTLTSVNPIQVFLAVAANLWILGMIAMVLYAAISYLRLRKKIAEAVEAEQGVWLCDHVDTPFILGILRPRIILPSSMAGKDREYVLAHERAHLRRRDHFWKPLGFALLTVYWFNPVLWVAYILLCRDIELACDERVIREMGTQEKKAYTTALLNCSVPRRMIAACPLAFGEVGVKQRIRNALHYKKPALWIIAVAVVASIVFAVCFLTDPKEELPEVYGHSYRVSEVVYGAPYLSFMYIPDHNTPYFSVTEDMHLLSKEQLQPGAEWTRLGKLEDFTLTKADFDDLFFAEYSFRDDTPKKLRRENAYAWRLDKEDPYYLLQQENGDLYIAYGTREMHWMFKLEADETVGADERADIPDLSHETTVAYAGYIRNYAIITGALNRDKMMESSIHHLPIYKFESEAELAKFESDFADDIANRAHGEVPCFDVVARQYDAEFFEEKTLFIVYVQASSGSCRYDVGSVVWGANSGSLTIHAEVTRSPATEDMAGWFLCVAMDKDSVKNCTSFDADLNAISHADKLIGKWATFYTALGDLDEDTPKFNEWSYAFFADGTGVHTVGENISAFSYITEGRLLHMRFPSANGIDDVKTFVYTVQEDSLILTDEIASSRIAILEKVPMDADAIEITEQPSGMLEARLFGEQNLPEEPKEIDSFSYRLKKQGENYLSVIGNILYLDNGMLQVTENGDFVFSFSIYQDALPHVEPLYKVLDSIVTVDYEGNRFDTLSLANEHITITLNEQAATVLEVRLGAGNGHRDFYITFATDVKLDLREIHSFSIEVE